MKLGTRQCYANPKKKTIIEAEFKNSVFVEWGKNIGMKTQIVEIYQLGVFQSPFLIDS